MTWSSINYQISIRDTLSLKGVAICAMLIHHLFVDGTEYGIIPYYLAVIGKVCVAIFVFLSAYGISVRLKEYDKIKPKNFCLFLVRRYTKFFFNYWFVFFLSVACGVFILGRSLDDAYGAESNLLFRFVIDFWGFGGFDSYNITWWFNAIILSLWFFFPLLYWLMRCRVASFFFILLLLLNPGDILYPLNFIAICLPFYVLPFSLGIWHAVHESKINAVLQKTNPYVILSVSFLMTFGLCCLRIKEAATWYILDSFETLFLVFFVVSYNHLFKESKILAFLGKHSMNIYLLHTFIFGYFFHNFIYSFENAIVIFTMLLTTSLLLSMMIEFFKKKIKFYWLLDKICKRLS